MDAIIHTVGILFPSKGLSYETMNRDAAINMARDLNEAADRSAEKRNFVMISSEKAPPFFSGYLTSKIEAENYILTKCPNLNATMLRPGFVVDYQHRSWSVPLSYGVDFAFRAGELCKSLPLVDYFSPARSVPLANVAHFAILGAMGQTESPIIYNQEIVDYR